MIDLYTENNKVEIAILQNLKEVIDPEIAINIVDLGLIYKVTYNGAAKTIDITMTLSSKGCPMGDLIMSQMKDCLNSYYTDCKVDINLVWDPKWSRDFITPAGRMELGMK